MLLIKQKPIRLFFGALETFNLLTLKLWLKNPRRARDFPSLIFRSYMSLVGQERWACRTVQEVFGERADQRIVFEFLRTEGISTPMAELASLALITRIVEPRAVFEIGTYRGRTALNFALNSPPDAEIFTMDLPPQNRAEGQVRATVKDAGIIAASAPGIDYAGKDGSEKIRQLFGNSLSFDFSPYFGKMDMVYIDGAHDYAAVRSDTQNALKLVKDGGWILWDDFGYYGEYNGVMRAIFELIPAEKIIQIESTPLAIFRKG